MNHNEQSQDAINTTRGRSIKKKWITASAVLVIAAIIIALIYNAVNAEKQRKLRAEAAPLLRYAESHWITLPPNIYHWRLVKQRIINEDIYMYINQGDPGPVGCLWIQVHDEGDRWHFHKEKNDCGCGLSVFTANFPKASTTKEAFERMGDIGLDPSGLRQVAHKTVAGNPPYWDFKAVDSKLLVTYVPSNKELEADNTYISPQEDVYVSK